MLKLTMSDKRDQFQTRTVLGSVLSIWSLYTQGLDLSKYHSVKVTTLDGEDITKMKLDDWYAYDTLLDHN